MSISSESFPQTSIMQNSNLSLGQKQELFAKLVPRLLDHAHSLGFSCRLGDVFRDPRVFGPIGVSRGYGHPRSAHKLKLAIDINLFKGGAFLSDTANHTPLGEWWEQQHILCRWGGRFGDGNHYSLEHNGVR